MTGLPNDKLRELIALLLDTNKQFNLTAVRDPEDAWNKHILDSLEGLQTGVFEAPRKIVDVGAGAGFPGLPLAIAMSGNECSFIEATAKKCNFIQNMMDHFNLRGHVFNMRAEDAGQDYAIRAAFDVATARAVGSLMEVAEYCLPLVKLGGHVVLWRGKDAESECRSAEVPLDTLGGALSDVHRYFLPGIEMPYHLVVLYKHSSTPMNYPRRVGIPKSKPLS